MPALDRLRSDEAFRRELVELVVDAILARRLRDLVDVTEFATLLRSAASARVVADVLRDHVEPAAIRFREHAGSLSVGDLVPEASRDAIEALLHATHLPAFAWARETVDSELFARLLAPVLSEWLMQFTSRLPGIGGLAGALAKRVGNTKGSKSVADKLRKLATDFSRSTLGSLRDALRTRLTSEEGQAILHEIRSQAFRRTLDVPLESILVELVHLPWPAGKELTPDFVQAISRSQVGTQTASREIGAFVDTEGDRTLGELAQWLGILPEVRAYLRVQGETLIEPLVAADAERTEPTGPKSSSPPEP